jgi:hypothetical protein
VALATHAVHDSRTVVGGYLRVVSGHLTAAAAATGPDMSAPGMLAAINNARRTALPRTSTSPGAADWELQEAAVPLAVTAVHAAALSGDREAVVASLQQQLAPMKPTPLSAAQVGTQELRYAWMPC